ncbi:hypothetical protein [Eubacterium xylanophilum]|uniref:hypothetical protein n=1 Tax=Eubacterium xylanophilum TaxID=39497 RepID=UPI0004790863|nr:hypothetical protein [Eubacterium xylanophilum]
MKNIFLRQIYILWITVLAVTVSTTLSGIQVPVTKAAAKNKVVIDQDIEVDSWKSLQELVAESEDEKEVVDEDADEKDDSDIINYNYKITLTSDIVASKDDGPLTLEPKKSVIIDLNGFTIERGLKSITDDGSVFHLGEKSRLTIEDSSEESTGRISGGFAPKGGAFYVESKAILKLSAGIVKLNKAKYGGGIYLEKNAEVELGTTSILNNEAIKAGGGIYSDGGQITFAGGRTKVKENVIGQNSDNGIEFSEFKTMKVTGKLNKGSLIVLSLPEIVTKLTTGYGEYNSVAGSYYFTYISDKYVISDDPDASEVMLVKSKEVINNNVRSTVEVYNFSEKLVKEVVFDGVSDAWSNAISYGQGYRVVLTLGGDWIIDDELKVKDEVDVTVDLNGHCINRNREHKMIKHGGVFLVKKNGRLTIKDSNPKSKGFDGVKGGVITGGASTNTGGGIHNEGGHVFFEGGTIYDCISNEDGGALLQEKGTFTMTGGRIYACQAVDSSLDCSGGGIHMNGGSITIKNARIEDCYSEDDGGAISSQRGRVTLNNVIFSGNKAHDDGGVIYIALDLDTDHAGTLLTARNCTFTDNEAENGGSAYIRDNPKDGAVLFDRCIFRNNKASEDGGAIMVVDDCVALSNTEITGNRAVESGGGVFVDARYDLTLKGLMKIRDNICDEDDSMRNVCLEKSPSATARIIDAGLYKDSCVNLGTTSGSSVRMAKQMSTFHFKYINMDEGFRSLKDKKDVDVAMVVTASIFSNGSIAVLLLLAGIGLLSIIGIFIYRKRRQRGVHYDA